MPPDQQQARVRSLRAFAIQSGLSPSEIDGVVSGNLSPTTPTGPGDVPAPMPASPQDETHPYEATPAPLLPPPPGLAIPGTPAPLGTPPPGLVPAGATPAHLAEPPAGLIPTKPLWTKPSPATPAAPTPPAELPPGVSAGATQVADGVWTVPHADPLKRQSVLGLIQAFPPKLRQAASAIAVASGDSAEKQLTDFLGKDLSEQEREQRMLDLLQQRQADKQNAGGEIDPTVAANWASGVKSGAFKISDVPRQYKDYVIRQLGPDVKPAKKLSPTEQKDADSIRALAETIDSDILPDLEPLKNDNRPGFFFTNRLGYAVGVKTKFSDLISFSERLAAVSARLLQGGRMSREMFERLNTHLPNFYKDSPALAYQKLQDVRRTLDG